MAQQPALQQLTSLHRPAEDCPSVQDWEVETLKNDVLSYAKTYYWSDERRKASGFDKFENIKAIKTQKYNDDLAKTEQIKKYTKKTAARNRCFGRLEIFHNLNMDLIKWPEMDRFAYELTRNQHGSPFDYTEDMSSVTDKLVFYRIFFSEENILEHVSLQTQKEWVTRLRSGRQPAIGMESSDDEESIENQIDTIAIRLGYKSKKLGREIAESEKTKQEDFKGAEIDNRHAWHLVTEVQQQAMIARMQRETDQNELDREANLRRIEQEKWEKHEEMVNAWHKMNGNGRRLVDISSELHPALAAPESTLTSASIATVAVILGFVAYKASQFLRSLKSNEDSEESKDSDVGNP